MSYLLFLQQPFSRFALISTSLLAFYTQNDKNPRGNPTTNTPTAFSKTTRLFTFHQIFIVLLFCFFLLAPVLALPCFWQSISSSFLFA